MTSLAQATRREAYESAQQRAPIARERILALLRAHCLNVEDIAKELRMPRLTVGARVCDLSRDGLIEEHGTNTTSTGHSAVVWRAIESPQIPLKLKRMTRKQLEAENAELRRQLAEVRP